MSRRSPATSRRTSLPFHAARAGSLLSLVLGLGCSLIVQNELSDKPGQGGGTSASTSTANGGGGAGGTGGTSTSSTSTTSGTGGHGGAPAGCKTDADCTGSADGPVCDPDKGACVLCTPIKDVCPAGQYCTTAMACALGCTDDGDCNLAAGGKLTCDVSSHQCLGCAADADCPPGALCDTTAAACVAGCNDQHTCPSGFACCNGTCADPLHDADNCGGCGKPCAPLFGVGKCAGGACAIGACQPGRADCNGLYADGCEIDLTTDATHCGTCDTVCSPKANALPGCSQGQCALGPCKPGYADCDNLAATGCEVFAQTDAQNCGACDNACAPPNTMASTCTTGACAVVTCQNGFQDCDHVAANGCEANTQTDVGNCGACGHACTLPNAVPVCAGAACAIGACAQGFLDCDGMPDDGCEVDSNTDPTHCGGCNTACTLAHATAGCSAGGCVVATCDAGYGDCNGDPSDGCETDLLTTVDHCGTCGGACSANNGTPSCAAGKCSITCAQGFDDCDKDPKNGCEVDLASNVNNCNTCNHVCPATGGTPNCVNGTCGVSSCSAGLGDCDGIPSNGCETTLTNSVGNCGACGNACSANHGDPSCAVGTCAISCDVGFGNCDKDLKNGCETPLTTLADCGACGAACSPVHALGSCITGTCAVASCTGTYADCDGVPTNGCEIDTASDADNCAACGHVCSNVHGTPSCGSGVCSIQCDAGFGDCDADPANGCETPTTGNVQACGGCGKTCAVQNGTPVCNGTTCAVKGCNAPFKDCNGQYADGCETNTATDLASCGACGNACNAVHANSAACVSGACKLACSTGFADCDGVGSNGCETTLGTNQNCSACGDVCAAGRACTSGACTTGWLSVSTTNAPAARAGAAAAWIGDKVFVWGGSNLTADLADGALYDNHADKWFGMANPGATLSARSLAAAVWTGTHAVVWGGGPWLTTGALATGARYTSANDSWTTMTSTGAPSARRSPIAVWSGTYMVIWGGTSNGMPVAGGARYDDANDAWLPMDAGPNAPTARSNAAFAWSGTELYVFGGRIGGTILTNEGYAYDPAQDKWRKLPTTGAPTSRSDAFATWMGNKLFVWDGRDATGTSVANGGGIYDPATNTWSAINATGAPTKRGAPYPKNGWAAWSGSKPFFVGGEDGTTAKHDGGIYNPAGAGTWTAIANFPSGKDHFFGVGVWTGQEMFVWGGLQGATMPTNLGDRYQP